MVVATRANQEGDKVSNIYIMFGKNIMSAHMLKVSLLGVGTVLHLERGAWSMVE